MAGRRDAKRDILPIDLADANLTRANLTHAHLTHAHLDVAYLDGAHLDGADFTDANLTGVSWPERAPVPEGWIRVSESGRLIPADRLLTA